MTFEQKRLRKQYFIAADRLSDAESQFRLLANSDDFDWQDLVKAREVFEEAFRERNAALERYICSFGNVQISISDLEVGIAPQDGD